MSRALLEFLAGVVPAENIRQQEPMSEHTTFRVAALPRCLLRRMTGSSWKR